MFPLASLIAKMTKREKFYFKKNHSDSENRTFMILYNYIEKNPQTTSEDLKRHFMDASFISSISVELNSLYQKLLRTLKVYRINSKDPVYVIQKNLSFVLILMEKDEIQQALKLLLKTKKIAYKHEEFAFLIKIISVEEEIKYHKIDSQIKFKTTQLNNETLEIIEEKKRINQLKNLKVDLLNLTYLNGVRVTDVSEIDSINYYGYFDQKNYETSITGKKLFNDCKAIQLILKGLPLEGSKYYKKNLDLINESSHIFDSTDKIWATQNYLFSLVDLSDYNLFYEVYNTHFLKIDKSKKNFPMLAYVDCYLRLRMELKMNHHEKIQSVLDETLPVILDPKTKLNSTQKDVIYFQVIYACITLRNFDKALDYIHNWDKHPIEEFSIIKRRILRMITFFELKKYRLLESEINAFSKILASRNAQNRFFDYLMKYFRSIIKKPNLKNELKNELYENMQNFSTVKEYESYFKEFHFHYWAEQNLNYNT